MNKIAQIKILVAVWILAVFIVGHRSLAKQSVLQRPEQLPQQTKSPELVPTASVREPDDQHQQPRLQNNVGANPPIIYRTEAFAGRPFGIGMLRYRMCLGDDMIDRSGATILTEKNNRVFYPVVSRPAAAKFLQSITGTEMEPDSLHSIWFLFKGDQPLELELQGTCAITQTIEVQVGNERRFHRLVDQWWREYTSIARKSEEWGDYPPMIETYLTSMLSHRMALPAPPSPSKSQDPLAKTLKLLFDVESLRAETVRQTMNGMIDSAEVTVPLPTDTNWISPEMPALKEDIEIEPIARCVPEECFYLRFGTWQNQLWLKRLLEEFGGDLSRMVSLRGYKSRTKSKFLNQLAIRSTEFDELFGGNLISDVAVIGNDMYFEDGSAVGVLLHSKNTDALNRNLIKKRTKFAEANQSVGVVANKIGVSRRSVHYLRSPDNRYRSFYIVDGDDHLITSSLSIVRRFISAAEGDGSLADSPEFRYARQQIPLDRDDTVFVFLPSRFFQGLLGPQYQIELARRNRSITEMQLTELALLAAVNEGVDTTNFANLPAGGFLPENFGQRPDGTQIIREKNNWYDSVRGRRGFFAPIPDMQISGVTVNEARWFEERRQFFTQSVARLDPMFMAVKRFELKDRIERVIYDGRIAPFGQKKYGWLLSMLGSPVSQVIVPSSKDIIQLQASLQGGVIGPNMPPHQLFAAIQDDLETTVDLRPVSFVKVLDLLRSTPGYIGSWPNAGYLDWLPRLGGTPDSEGFTYSRILDLWRLQWADYSAISLDRNRLQELKSSFEIQDARRPAQIRLQVGDLANSKLRTWSNAQNYRRSWQTSIANIRMLNMLTQQFRLSPESARETAEQLLDVELVCSLGGEYHQAETGAGRQVWQSTAWPNFSQPVLPDDYTAPLLRWFRGLQLEVAKNDSQFLVHGYLDIQRSANGSNLPPFKLFKGFSNLFVGDKKAKEDKSTENKNDQK